MADSRLFQILYYLLNRGEATASELAEKFEVSARTIYRDIDKLSSAGIPVYTIAGYKGGVRLDEAFVLKKSVLSRDDMQNILMGVQSLSAVGFSESAPIVSKLQALFQMQSADWIEVDYSRWGCDSAEEKRLFGLLKEAIRENRQVRFQYYNANGESVNRECRPLKLLFKDRAWYLHAYCLQRNAMRVFRLSRIRELEITNQRFEPVSQENLHFESVIQDNMIQVELSFAKKVAHRVYDVFDKAVIMASEGRLIIKVAIPEDEWLYGFLMSFGDSVTILSPVSLKEKIKKRLQIALKHYEA